jgi:dihydrodipicolinate synthase/N-acetylneuraminate lyase
VPQLCTEIFSLARAGQHTEALRLQQQITPFARLVTTIHSIAGLKAAMEIAGHRGGAPRLPMQPLSDAARSEIEQCLHSLSPKSFS